MWWRKNLEESQWGPRYWGYYAKGWIYIADNNDEFVYVRDLQHNDRFRHWAPRTPWDTFATSYIAEDGHRVWDQRLYARGNA
eukprot:9064093-Pyramimonas_sp.AAC.1